MLESFQSCWSHLTAAFHRHPVLWGGAALVLPRPCVWYPWHFCLNSSDSVEARQGQDWKWAGWQVRTLNQNSILYHFQERLTIVRFYSSPGATKIQVSGIMIYLAFCQLGQLVWCGSNVILLYSFASWRLPFSCFPGTLRAEYGTLYSCRSWLWQ